MPVKIRGSSGIDRIHPDVLERKNLVTDTDLTSATSKAYFSGYANASQSDITNETIVDINHAWQNSGDFTLSSSRVTVNKTGKYHIIADVGTYVSSESSSRSQSLARIYINGTQITGSLMWIYNREGNDNDEGHGNASASVIWDLTAGDIVDIRGNRYSGTDTVGFRGNSSRITIMEI